MSDTPVEKMSFEDAMKELESVVGMLEAGEVPLEDSVKLYERGAALKEHCQKKLAEAEEKVARITLDAEGRPDRGRKGRRRVTFLERMNARASEIGACLKDAVSEFPEDRIRDGMVHALRGGKRLRGFLVLESAALHGVPGESAIWAAAAVEAIHAYSLVHDDLPAMDNDDMRRGHPTVHVKWDEATADPGGRCIAGACL